MSSLELCFPTAAENMQPYKITSPPLMAVKAFIPARISSSNVGVARNLQTTSLKKTYCMNCQLNLLNKTDLKLMEKQEEKTLQGCNKLKID